MGNSSGKKFQGTGHALGGAPTEKVDVPSVAPPVVPIKKTSIASSLFASSPAGKSSTTPTTKKTTKSQPRTPEEQAAVTARLAEKRQAAAAAATRRNNAWEERLAKQRAKREETQEPTSSLKWNESSLPPMTNTGPLDPEIARKQKAAKDLLEKSGFNPYQATMASSSVGRALIDNATTAGLPASKTPPPPSIQESDAVNMARSRTRLLEAMKGSDVSELKLAIQFAIPYDVPELEEAKEIYLVLVDQQNPDNVDEEEEDANVEEEEDGLDFSYLSHVIASFACDSTDDRETKKLARNTLVTILKNLLTNPEEAKFRKIRLSNKTIQDRIAKPMGCVAILEAVGFTQTLVDNEVCLVVPEPKSVTPQEVEYCRRACELAMDKLQTINLG